MLLISSICLDLKPPYATEVIAKPYLVGTSLHSFRSLMEDGATRGSTFFHFLDSMLIPKMQIHVCESSQNLDRLGLYLECELKGRIGAN